eukprot:UN07766
MELNIERENLLKDAPYVILDDLTLWNIPLDHWIAPDSSRVRNREKMGTLKCGETVKFCQFVESYR